MPSSASTGSDGGDTPIRDRPLDDESETAWHRLLDSTEDADIHPPVPYGSGPLFRDYPDWLEGIIAPTGTGRLPFWLPPVDEPTLRALLGHTPQEQLPPRLRRRDATLGGAHEYRHQGSEDAEAVEEEQVEEEELEGPTRVPSLETLERHDSGVRHGDWRDRVDEEADVGGS